MGASREGDEMANSSQWQSYNTLSNSSIQYNDAIKIERFFKEKLILHGGMEEEQRFSNQKQRKCIGKNNT